MYGLHNQVQTKFEARVSPATCSVNMLSAKHEWQIYSKSGFCRRTAHIIRHYVCELDISEISVTAVHSACHVSVVVMALYRAVEPVAAERCGRVLNASHKRGP